MNPIRVAIVDDEPLARRGIRQLLTPHADVVVEGEAGNGTDAVQMLRKVAPDLTHVASRKTLAAGTLPMSRGHLYGWVADPQGPKPGNNMPPNLLRSDDLQALLSYLETLR